MCEIVNGDSLVVCCVVRERLGRGAHAVEMMTSGGAVSPDDPNRQPPYSSGEIRTAVDEAERSDSHVAAHAFSPEAIRPSVTNGIRSIGRGSLPDDDASARLAAEGARLAPTLVAYDAMDRRGAGLLLSRVSQAKNREVLDSGKEAITLARSAGVHSGIGSHLVRELQDDQLIVLRLQGEANGMLNTLWSATSWNTVRVG